MGRRRFTEAQKTAAVEQRMTKKACPGCRKLLGRTALFQHRVRNCGRREQDQPAQHASNSLLREHESNPMTRAHGTRHDEAGVRDENDTEPRRSDSLNAEHGGDMDVSFNNLIIYCSDYMAMYLDYPA